MKAVILAGGMGIRLRPFTFSIPKPLLPIGEKPILEIIIRQLKKFGFKEFIMAVGYKSRMIQAYFGDGSDFGVKIHYLTERKSSGTAGPLAQLRKKFKFGKNESFLLMNGDILSRLNFHKIVKYHERNNLEITIGVKDVKARNAYGIIDIKDGMVKRIIEKPFDKQTVSAGIYMIKPSVLEDIPSNRFFTMPNLVNKLTSKGRLVGVYNIKEFWLGMESLKHFEKMHNNRSLNKNLIKGLL